MLPLCLFGCPRQIRDSQRCVLADGTYADAQRDRACHHTSAIDQQTLLLRRWYEIIALYYIKSILTDFSASGQDKMVL